MLPDLALLSTLIRSNYPCLELIFMVPKVFESLKFYCLYILPHTCSHKIVLTIITGWERTGQMFCIVDTSLSVLMTLRMCLRELCCLFTVWI